MNARLPETSSIPERISALRAEMTNNSIAAYLVLSTDPHLSEYLPERWQAQQWLSGFTGSMGTLIVTQEHASIWTDSRYWIQAQAQLTGTGVQLIKMMSSQQIQPYVKWLAQYVPTNSTVATDGTVLSIATARTLHDALNERGIQLRTNIDLLNTIWRDRPELPLAAVYEHVVPHAVHSRATKLNLVRQAMQEKGAQWHFISTLDDIAWLLNLRSADVKYNPVFVAHALIGLEQATLFITKNKVPNALTEALACDGIQIEPYVRTATAIAELPANTTLLIDPRGVTFELIQKVPLGVTITESLNPSTYLKSRKTRFEIEHVRSTMEQDGAALAEFFTWFESTSGREKITELDIDQQLTTARARRVGFISPSFETVAAFKANGAMPHYRATPTSHSVIAGDGLLLIDSGGQYLDGTTDITRVVPVGIISDVERCDFTIVLKAMIALSRTQFPYGIRSPMLDAIARAPIWEAHADYGHGTGHGVGYFLNVHEGPQVISYHASPEPWTAMEEGMITSVEPGIYRLGKWGIRIENLMLNCIARKNEFGNFLKFETLTLCPIDTRCITLPLLRDDERAWLNKYHETVRKRVAPHVNGNTKTWLETRTRPI